MKKLFVPLLLLAAVGASAQERDSVKQAAMKSQFDFYVLPCGGSFPTPRTSVSLIGGPNWLLRFSPILSSADPKPRIGYTLGIDLARRLERDRWHLKLGFRYHVWPTESVTWEQFGFTLDSTGQLIATPTESKTVDLTEKAWQYSAGVRWLFGQPKHWHWYADAEIGMTDVVSSNSDRDALRFTPGLAVGVQWKPTKHFSLFAQPGARYVFPSKITSYNNYKRLPLHLEMGTRWEM